MFEYRMNSIYWLRLPTTRLYQSRHRTEVLRAEAIVNLAEVESIRQTDSINLDTPFGQEPSYASALRMRSGDEILVLLSMDELWRTLGSAEGENDHAN